jgi:hypothetical protein
MVMVTGQTHKYAGGCHCGAVRFEVELDALAGSRCNCTICTKTNTCNAIVKPAKFRLLTSADAMTHYGRSEVAGRLFCSTCGVQCFGRGHLAELGGDFVSVNLQTFDDVEINDVKIVYWDGRHNNWQSGTRETPWRVDGADA